MEKATFNLKRHCLKALSRNPIQRYTVFLLLMGTILLSWKGPFRPSSLTHRPVQDQPKPTSGLTQMPTNYFGGTTTRHRGQALLLMLPPGLGIQRFAISECGGSL